MAGFDLHFHSTYSDGKLSIPVLAALIKEKKFNYCALTDHNTVDGIRELEARLEGSGTKVIPGIELTAKYGENEVHILAYDFDIDTVAKILKERNEIVRVKKIEEMKLAINLFHKQGFKLTHDLAPSEKQPVSLTVALDICANSANQNLLVERHGKVFGPEHIFYEYQAPGKPCTVERSGVTVEWLVQKFRGIAQDLVIAHPFVSVSVVTKPLDETEIDKLLKIGVTGIEVYHDNTPNEQIDLLKKIVRGRVIHYTGGSDFHGKITDTPIGQYGPTTAIPDFNLSNYKSNHLSK